MNGKYLLWAALAVLLAVLLIHAQAPQRAAPASPQSAARFQISSLGYMYAVGAGPMLHTEEVLRIDADTGSVWRLNSVVSNGKIDERWIKIQEPQ